MLKEDSGNNSVNKIQEVEGIGVDVFVQGTLIHLPSGYKPLPDESYMCIKHLAFFKHILLSWQNKIKQDSQETIHDLKDKRLGSDENQSFALRISDRMCKLSKKIDHSLRSIESGTYGYCEESGEEIGINRLISRPIAALCIKMQEKHEMAESNQDKALRCQKVLFAEEEK